MRMSKNITPLTECFQDLEPQDSLLQSAFTSTKDFMKVPHIPCPPSASPEQDLGLWLKDQPYKEMQSLMCALLVCLWMCGSHLPPPHLLWVFCFIVLGLQQRGIDFSTA